MSPRGIGVVLVLCGMFAACAKREPVAEPPPQARGLRQTVEPTQPTEAPDEEPSEPGAPEEPEALPQQAPAAEVKPAEPVAAAADKAGEKEADKPPPRDYGGELRNLISDASSCVKRRTDPNAPAEVSVSIEAVVMESGMVTRAYASASALDNEETGCLQRRVAALHMLAPVENAPRTVNTTFTLQLLRAAAPARPAPAPTEGMGEPDQPMGAPLGAENQAPDPYAVPTPSAEQPAAPAEQPTQPEQPQ